jgi:hypothetical protein
MCIQDFEGVESSKCIRREGEVGVRRVFETVEIGKFPWSAPAAA